MNPLPPSLQMSKLYFISTSPQSPQTPTTPQQIIKRGPDLSRYHLASNPQIQCHNCRQFGHTRPQCTNPSYKGRCNYCGKTDHTAFNCKLIICHRCNGTGHKIAQCRNTGMARCYICQCPGHLRQDCLLKEKVSQRDQQKIRCIVCNERGHLNCKELREYSRSVYCSWCGERGHVFRECGDRRIGRENSFRRK